MISIFDIDKLS